MIAGKTLLDYTNLFPNNYKWNDKRIYKYFIRQNMAKENKP